MSTELQQHHQRQEMAVEIGAVAEQAAVGLIGKEAANTPDGRAKVKAARLMIASVVAGVQATGKQVEVDAWSSLNPSSIARATLSLIALNLSPTAAVKEAYLFPQGGELQVRVSPAGLVKLAARSGQIVRLGVVREGDEFDTYTDGEGLHFHHRPVYTGTGERSERRMIGAYCTVRYQGKLAAVTFLDAAQIKARRQAAKQDYVWSKWPEEMAKKSALHRALAESTIIFEEGMTHALAANEHDRDDGAPPSPIVQVSAPRPPSLTMSGKALEVFDVEQTADPVSEEGP